MIVTLARKPLSGTVASNTLKYGTGGLNINASRIKAQGEVILTHTQGRDAANSDLKVYGRYAGGFKTHQAPGQELGRFPANLILQHFEGCHLTGCSEGCPVKDMDSQSGILKSGAMDSIAKGDRYNTYGKMYERRVVNPASEGGASRFFKQV